MKYYLEEEQGEGEEMVIVKIKECKDKAEAEKDKNKDQKIKSYVHTCYHDEQTDKGCRPCKREKI